MSSIVHVLGPVLVALTALVLCVGVYSLFRGGDFNRSWSNRLMRLRVVTQFLAIIVIMTALWLSGG